MTYKDNNIYFFKCLDLESMGFILIDTDDETYQFKKTENKVTVFLDVIIISNKLHGIGSWLVYDEIESLIDSFMIKYQIEDVKRYPMTINFYKLRLSCSYMFEAYNTPFENKEKISLVSDVVKRYIHEDFMPLWRKYGDLQIVNDEIINKISIDKLSDYISGVSMHFKVLIIMKKCNNSVYQSYLDNQLKALLELSESELGKSQAEQYFDDSLYWKKQYEMMLEIDTELKLN